MSTAVAHTVSADDHAALAERLGRAARAASLVLANTPTTTKDAALTRLATLIDGAHDALTAANTARCTCGCGMTLAQCVSTDMTCPLRESNIQSIRAMVRAADKS